MTIKIEIPQTMLKVDKQIAAIKYLIDTDVDQKSIKIHENALLDLEKQHCKILDK